MNILGLNFGEINSSAALVSKGEVVAASPEERFNRQKQFRGYPKQAVSFCLERSGMSLADCSAIAQGWNPGASWEKFNPLLSNNRRDRSEYFYSIADHLLNADRCLGLGDWVRMEQAPGSGLPPIYFVQHHRCHAANAFFLSPFDEAAILTSDFRGELECASWSHGKGNAIENLSVQKMPHSLGAFYATFTELLGYRPDNDEWKVMALSAFDVNYGAMLEKLRETYRLLPNGRLELDQSYYKANIYDQPHLFTQKLVDLLGGRIGVAFEEPGEWHLCVAKAMQAAAEEIAVHFLNHLHELTKSDNLAVAGGFFMNSVFNGRIVDRTPFKNIFVPFAPTDAGNSIGAALYVHHVIEQRPRAVGRRTSYLGPQFDDTAIEAALGRRSVRYETVDNPAKSAAHHLEQGRIVAWFQGAMEFGDRALGNRSILADPRHAKTKDKINSMIKYREPYRPFAPVVPAEEAATYFQVEAGFACPYMEKVVPIREAYREELGAVTHVDGSGRVQTVAKEDNPLFYRLLREFEALTGVPIVLNTSFNINGEPIVLSPDDAITTFFNSGLEVLIMGSYVLVKTN
jgi:carbamoyltransferase